MDCSGVGAAAITATAAQIDPKSAAIVGVSLGATYAAAKYVASNNDFEY